MAARLKKQKVDYEPHRPTAARLTKELPMTVPEPKSTVYLLPEVAWPIIKQNVGNTGNRVQCPDVTSDALG